MTSNSKHCPQCSAPLPANAPAGLCPRCVMAMNMATETEFPDEVGPHGTRVLKQPPTPAELADKFPQLEILELLGRGGMGAVYKARQKELDRIVALKILPPGLGDDPAFGERFSREAKALAKLNHPNIVTLYEFGRADGLFFFLMEFVDGVNLRQLLDTGRVASREALAIVPQICDALQYAHDQGIVHRDIKPENILMDRRGRVKVADFGLAKLVGVAQGGEKKTGLESPVNWQAGKPALQGEVLTDAGKIMGTPQYMAPEQKEKPLEVDHRADIYALGVVFYQMLTGELPAQRIEPPSKKVQIDVRLDEIVLRALEKDPERRYGQASVFKTEVESVASGLGEKSSQPGVASPPPHLPHATPPIEPGNSKTNNKSPRPWLLWIALIPIGIGALANLVLIPKDGVGSLVQVIFNVMLLAGLWNRFRLAYLATMVSGFFGWAIAFKLSLPYAVLLTIVTLTVLLPVLACTRWFFPQEIAARRRNVWLGSTAGLSLAAFLLMLAAPLPSKYHSAAYSKEIPSLTGRAINTFPEQTGRGSATVSLESVDRRSDQRFLDIDTGRIVKSPREYSDWSRTRREQWLNESGIDLMVLGNNLQPWSLLTPVDNPIQLEGISMEIWRRGIEPEPGATTALKGEELQFSDLNLGLVSYGLKHHRPTHPEHTFLFQTANGRRGMMRISRTIVEGVETLVGVKIDFKALANGEPILFEPVHFDPVHSEGAINMETDPAPRTDFAAKLPDGSFVELVSIQYGGGSTPRRQPGSTNVIDFWNPDGSKHQDNIGWSFSPSALSPKRVPGLEYRGFVVHWNGPATNNTRLMDWKVNGNPDASGFFNVNAPTGESAENWLGILQGFPADQNTANLRFALASGPYLEGPITKTNFIWSRTDKTPWGSYSIGKIFNHNGNAAITLTHDLKGCDYRLYTQFDQLPRKPKSLLGGLLWEWQEESRRDERYKRIFGRVVKGGTGSRQSMEVFEFPGVPAQEAMVRLPSIYFEVRPVQWVEFENVALNPEEQTRLRIQTAQANETATASAHSFTSTFEPTLPDPDNGNGKTNRETLDLGTGEMFNALGDAPKLQGGRMRALVASRGDLFAEYDDFVSKRWGLVVAGMKLSDFPTREWDAAKSENINQALETPTALTHTAAYGANIYLLPEEPFTLAFETSDGAKGLLQIIRMNNEPRSLSIRYKLLKDDEAKANRSTTTRPPELTVALDGSANYTTIQTAIDAAPDHATIRIGPGRYPEKLVITKPLTLRGAGWNQTVIGPTEPDRMPSEEEALTWQRRIMQTTDKAERDRIAAEFQEQFMPAVLKISEAKLVACFDLKFTQPGIPPENGGLPSRAAVDISATEVLLKNCAVLGGPGDGVRMENGAVVTIQNSLIAAAWNAGVRIGSDGQLCKARITDSDIRNCYHRGIVIGSRQNDVTIERCRISGSAWHGIRYDNASPVIRDNIVFGNARSGIYASGSTAAIVRGNLFWRNEMGGMSCWYSNTDTIEQNTFTGNLREGISILGMSEPSVLGNIFHDHPTAISQAVIGDPRGTAQSLGTPLVTTNLFWNNQTNWIRFAGTNAPQMKVVAFQESDGNVEKDPRFKAAAENDYSLQAASPAFQAGIGAKNLPNITSPWPVQPEESAIIPDTETRDYKAWKRPQEK